jgi:hypothetical protein
MDEAPVSQEAPDAPVPICEGVDALEAGMLAPRVEVWGVVNSGV